MKLGILPVSLFKDIVEGRMSIAAWAKLAQECGADGFDVSTLFWKNHTPTYIDEIRREMEQLNVTIQPNMVCTYPDFTNPDAMERERQLDYLRRDIALASALGFRTIRITAGMAHPGISFEKTCKSVAEYFARANETALKYGIQLVFENHAKPGAWPLVDFSFDPKAFLTICGHMKDTGVGVNFDTANAVACGEDPMRLIREVMPLVKTIHLNDTSMVGTLIPVLLGTGLVDFERFFKELKDNGFNGWVSIEEASGRGKNGIGEAIDFARRFVAADAE